MGYGFGSAEAGNSKDHINCTNGNEIFTDSFSGTNILNQKCFGESFNSNIMLRFNSNDKYEDYSYSCGAMRDFQKISKGLVGIIQYGTEILGFADSRCSEKCEGVLKGNEERSTVKKLFVGKDFLITFSGTCSFLIESCGNLMMIYLEDWVEEHITEFDSPQELCDALYHYLNENSAVDFDPIYVLAGYYPCGDKKKPVIYLRNRHRKFPTTSGR